MIYLDRKDIDTKKWNDRIAADATENVFCYSWYLDAVADNWGALVNDQTYATILPVPFTTKLGVKQMYQAPFTREYDIFGNDFGWNEALPFLSAKFSHFSFRNRSAEILENPVERIHQELKLTADYPTAFRSNAKRLIKKGNKNFRFEAGKNPETLINLFKDTVASKVNAVGDKELNRLTELMNDAQKRDTGQLIYVYQNDTLVAGGFFLKDKKRITYLKGASQDEAKKLGAMYALFAYAFELYQPHFETFDFGGSDVENVAQFFKKFGAIDRIYYNYILDKNPRWFKTLKRLAP